MPNLLLVRNLLLVLVCWLCSAIPVTAAEHYIGFTGGPDGGTFEYFANGIATRLEHRVADLRAVTLPSAGSLENIRRLNAREADFGIAYAGDLYLAEHGLLNKDPQKYRNVLAVAFLYQAPVQLAVLAESGIDSIHQLVGKRIAIGGAGSGSAASAQRFFSGLGLWDQLRVEFIGFTKAAAALQNHTIDAMWVMAGLQTAAVSQLAVSNRIRLLDLGPAAERSGLFRKFPFYTHSLIPAGTYQGVNRKVSSFQDAAVWIASSHVPAPQVEQALAEIFSPEGLTYLCKIKGTARQMGVLWGLTDITTPLHPGAKKFWRHYGVVKTPKKR